MSKSTLTGSVEEQSKSLVSSASNTNVQEQLDQLGGIPDRPKTTFSGSGEEQQFKQQQLDSLFSNVSSLQGQLNKLGDKPGISSQLSGLLGQQQRNTNLTNFSLNLANKLGGYFGSMAIAIRKKVKQGFFVSSARSKYESGRSSFSVTYGKLTQGLDKLISAQRAIDQSIFQAKRDSLISQLNISQNTLSIFERNNTSVRDSLKREQNAVAKLRKRRGRISLRTQGSRTDLLDNTETTSNLLG